MGQICCPHCHGLWNKTAYLEMVQDIVKSGGTYWGMVSSKTTNCPICGLPIDIDEIIEGKHDAVAKPMSLGEKVKGFIGLLIITLLLIKGCSCVFSG